MATVAISRDEHNRAEVNLHGATLTSWKVAGEELTFVSRNAVFDGKKAIRGGIPVVFPNFGPWDLGPQHGFARTSTWKLVEPPSQGKPVAVFELEDNEQTRAMWNYSHPHAKKKVLSGMNDFFNSKIDLSNEHMAYKHLSNSMPGGIANNLKSKEFPQFKVRYSVIVGEHQLETKLDITNTGDQPFDFTALLHTYFRLPDINKTTVDGLKGCAYFDKVLKEQKTEGRELVSISGETDSMYGATSSVHHITNGAGGYMFVVTKHNLPDTVVWNPWAEKAKAMSDFGDDEYMNMICVEAGHVTSRYVLQPKQTFCGGQTITLKK